MEPKVRHNPLQRIMLFPCGLWLMACDPGGYSARDWDKAGRLYRVWGGVVPGGYNRRTQRNGRGGCPWNTARTPFVPFPRAGPAGFVIVRLSRVRALRRRVSYKGVRQFPARALYHPPKSVYSYRMQLVTWDDVAKTGGLGYADTETPSPTALTIGVFDGIHRGHRALIDKIVNKAPLLVPAVLTFRDNPKKSVRPEAFEGDILEYGEKLRLFETLGIALCVVIDFSADFCKLDGREFFGLAYRFLRPAYAVIGSNFRCGFGRDTGAEAFRLLGQETGVEVEIVPPVLEGGLPVSSSRIRSALGAGNLEEAALLLGRPLTAEQAGFGTGPKQFSFSKNGGYPSNDRSNTNGFNKRRCNFHDSQIR